MGDSFLLGRCGFGCFFFSFQMQNEGHMNISHRKAFFFNVTYLNIKLDQTLAHEVI